MIIQSMWTWTGSSGQRLNSPAFAVLTCSAETRRRAEHKHLKGDRGRVRSRAWGRPRAADESGCSICSLCMQVEPVVAVLELHQERGVL
mmetsp:Transcript_27960/g.41688  ORF Transcript_27960/g.41688 Transcript_27960/m.41688 type:complete len:89 (-) Transcript_27960:290-556(-)